MGALAQHCMGEVTAAGPIVSRIKEQFIPIRLSMLESPAYRTLSVLARRVLNAIELEHLKHGGKDNNRLIVPYKTLCAYCCTANRRTLAQAIRELEALGFIIVIRGHAGNGVERAPNMFGLTYLPGHNGGPPSDNWKDISTIEEAQARLAAAKKGRPQSDWFKGAKHVGAI
jgi:hypothetical protein